MLQRYCSREKIKHSNCFFASCMFLDIFLMKYLWYFLLCQKCRVYETDGGIFMIQCKTSQQRSSMICFNNRRESSSCDSMQILSSIYNYYCCCCYFFHSVFLRLFICLLEKSCKYDERMPTLQTNSRQKYFFGY